MFGSDDILFTIPSEIYSKSILEEMKEEFFLQTGSTLSFGVGTNILMAMNNLNRAKLLGKNRIVDFF